MANIKPREAIKAFGLGEDVADKYFQQHGFNRKEVYKTISYIKISKNPHEKDKVYDVTVILEDKAL